MAAAVSPCQNSFLKPTQPPNFKAVNVRQPLHLPSSRLSDEAVTTGQLSKYHCLVAYTTVLKPVFSCSSEISIKGQEVVVSATLWYTRTPLFSVFM